jgi:uncharacterized protein YndB with AHSA1/START domain
MTDAQAGSREFTLTWRLDASPDDVFRAWTDPEHLGWFYNDTQPVPDEPIEVDLRVGGVWRQLMVIDEETSYPTGGLYREVVPGERLVYAWGAEGGWPELDPDNLDQSPLITVLFDRAGQGTEMTVHVSLPASFIEKTPTPWLDHIETGMRDTVDRLVAALGSAAAATS